MVYWVTQDVDASFDVISGLIVSHSMIGLYSDDLPELKLRSFALQALIQQKQPKSFDHLKKVGV